MQQHICSSPNCSHPSHKNRPFVNLHIHSPQSLLDGVGKTQDYIKLAKEYGHPGLAITDHGNPAHLFDHYKLVKSAGLKPILGEEFYLALDLGEKIPNRNREVEKKDKHQTVLIKNKQGYKNFCKLTYLSFTEGYYAKPRINYDMLFENKNGLIVTSGCAASMFNQLLNIGKEKEAEEWFKRFVGEFGDDFYGEIQFNELLDKSLYGMNQKEMNDFIIKMCNKYDVPIIIGGDTHYAHKEDANLQDILITAQRRKDGVAEDDATKDTEEKKKDFMIHARHLYYHQSEDYYKFNEEFGYNYDEKLITDALDNSLKILDKVDFDFDTKTNNFPKYNYDIKLYNNSHELLEKLAWKGLLEKLRERKEKGEVFTDDQITEYEKRLEIELEVIKEKEFTDYFLVVQDVVLWAKNNNIAVGPGRGSASGALLSYSLFITDIDPIKHDLLFERFINKFREAKPDVDLDFEQGAREKIRHYLEDKYGKDAVLGVVTFHQYGPKSALQDISRGLKRDTSFQSTLMKEITKLPGLDEQKDLVQYFDSLLSTNITPTVQKWILDNQDTIKYANKILDQPKNLGTHAGGILIAPGPVYNYIPVTRGGKEVVTAFKEADGSSKDLSELGLLKLDVLGLKTLNVIYRSIENIQKDLGINITNDIRYINLEDPHLYELIRKGNLLGIFQLDGNALPLVKAVSPTRFEDIVAINSLNRPGPLETFGPIYARWKRFFEEGNKHLCKEDSPEIFPRLDFMQEITEKNYYCIDQEELIYNPLKGVCENFKSITHSQSHNNIINPVLGFIDNGIQEVYEYTLQPGYTIKCTKDHKVLTPVGELSIEQCFQENIPILIPQKLESPAGVFSEREKDKARLLGLLLGDGSLSVQASVNFCNANECILDDFTSLVNKLYPTDEVIRKKASKGKGLYVLSVVKKVRTIIKGTNRANYTCSQLCGDLRELGLKNKYNKNSLGGVKSHTKFIPEYIFTAHVEVKRAFLSGLWDADGSKTSLRPTYGTVSKQLAEGMFLLFRQLGALPTFNVRKGIYVIEISTEEYISIIAPHSKFLHACVSRNNKPGLTNHLYYNVNLKQKINQNYKNLTQFCKKHQLNANQVRSVINKKITSFKSIANITKALGENTSLYENYYCVKIKNKRHIGAKPVFDLTMFNVANPWFTVGNSGILVHNCMLHQEDFMQMVVKAADFNLGEADNFRRAIAWREDHPKYYTVKKYFDQLQTKMLEKGYSQADVDYFLDYCRKFSGYSFNASHSCLTKNTSIIHETLGPLNILDVKVGDKILTFDTKNKKQVYKKVTKYFIQGNKKVFRITTESGKTLELTEDHQIMTPHGMKTLKEIIEQKLEIQVLK